MREPKLLLAWVCHTQLLPLSKFHTPSGVYFSHALAALFHAAATHRVFVPWSNLQSPHLVLGGVSPVSVPALPFLCPILPRQFREPGNPAAITFTLNLPSSWPRRDLQEAF